MTATEDAVLCARHRYYGEVIIGHSVSVPAYWKTWGGPVEPSGDRVVLIQSDGRDGPWMKAPPITTDLDYAIGFLDHVLPGRVFSVRRCVGGGYGAWTAPKVGLSEGTKFDPSPARALVLATLAALPEYGDPAAGLPAADGDVRPSTVRTELELMATWIREHPLLAVETVLKFVREHADAQVVERGGLVILTSEKKKEGI